MYIIDGKEYYENPSLKIGGGSEGDVYAFNDDPKLCVKLYHEPDPNDRNGSMLANYRLRKVRSITSLSQGLALPARFNLPEKPITIGRNGHLMRRVPSGFVKIMELLKMPYRINNDIDLKKICLLFANIFDDASLLHSKDIVIRDVNTGCILINPQLDREYVDTDSWSYPGFPSLATTELFAHPDLFGDLKSSGQLVEAKPEHDRFALTVMFVLMALHGAHPFRMGIHKTYTSLQERANNGVTIFDDDVSYPAILPPRETLSDELLHTINQILKQQSTEAINTQDLRDFANDLSTCGSCGLQFHSSRNACPKCQAPSVFAIAARIIKGLFETEGTILFVQAVEDILYVACRVYGQLQVAVISENSQRLVNTGMRAQNGARYRFMNGHIAICNSPYSESPIPIEIYKIENDSINIAATTTSGNLMNSSVVFDTSDKFFYRTAGNTLLCGRFFGKVLVEEAVTSDISRNQTWFIVDRQSRSDKQVVFGFDRSLREIQWFISVGDCEGENFAHHKPDLPLRNGEKLDDFSVYFNKSSVLLVRKTSYKGVENIHYSVINHNGSVSLSKIITEQDSGFKYWQKIDGKLYQSASVVHLSQDGLVKQNLNTDTYSLVSGTESVTITDRLLRFGNTLAVVQAKSISVLTSK